MESSAPAKTNIEMYGLLASCAGPRHERGGGFLGNVEENNGMSLVAGISGNEYAEDCCPWFPSYLKANEFGLRSLIERTQGMVNRTGKEL